MKTQKAFTITEILVVIGIIGILTIIAVPGMLEMYTNSKITTKTNELIATINYVKNNAMTRTGMSLELKPIDSELIPIDSTNWSDGWQIGDYTTVPNKIVKTLAFYDQINIYSNRSSVFYLPRGRVRQTYEFYICDPSYPLARKLTIDNRGKVTAVRCTVGDATCPNSCSP
jgi:type IV fimbrial biogenesis protein FimT